MYAFFLFIEHFLLVIGGALENRVTDEMELISLDTMNYPVPTALQKLRRLPVDGLIRGGAIMKPDRAASSEKMIHVYGKKELPYAIKQICCHYSVWKDYWMTCQETNVQEHASYALHRETNKLYTTGGFNLISTAQFTNGGSSFHSLPPMPEGKHLHCTAVSRNGNIFVAGGYGSKSCFLYENEKNQWKKCPDMMKYKHSAMCGVVKRAESGMEEIIMVGGYNEYTYQCTVEIYSLDKSEWRSGNPFPHQISCATVVSYGNSFLLVGGICYGPYLSTIYRYNPEEDSWTLLDGRMKNGKCSAIAMLVKREIFEKESGLVKTSHES
jgi:hypothetical protein